MTKLAYSPIAAAIGVKPLERLDGHVLSEAIR